jgi:unspecific monooxygenase
MSSSLTVPRWLPLPSVRRAVRADDRLRALIADRVAARRAHPHNEPTDMLDLLLDGGPAAPDRAAADRAAPGRAAPSNDDVIAVLKSAMLASVGSPGAVLTWALYAMLRHPRAHQRLRDEARRSIAETGSLVDDTPLTYTKAFIREVLRMWPPTWLMGRAVRRPCEVGGYPLGPGQEVMFSPYLLHRDARWWPEPDRFRPERWLERDPSGTRRAGAYLPFGSGPRICLGLHLSLYQLVTTTAHLAANYRVAADLAGVEPLPEAMLLPRGLRARVRLRGDATPPPIVPVRADVAPVPVGAGGRR